MTIVKNQKKFFDLNFRQQKPHTKGAFSDFYGEEIARNGFIWLKKEKKILDYGCGSGTSLDLYLESTKNFNSQIIGVDISEEGIKQIKKKYSQYSFFKISHNLIPQIHEETLDAVYLTHILHHTRNHQAIFNEISKKLKKSGKFFICDLTSNNPIINIARMVFLFVPISVRNKFSDDLVVDGDIPNKYKVDVNKTIDKLKKSGFNIVEINYKHLFLFVFFWINTILKINETKSSFYLFFLKKIYNLESLLLKYNFFKYKAHMFSIKCIKNKLKK